MGSVTLSDVLSNALWILGLAVIVATWSYARYAAYRSGVRVRDRLEALPYALAVDAGLLLLIAGLVWTETRWWARVLWGVLGVSVFVEGGMRVWAERRGGDDG